MDEAKVMSVPHGGWTYKAVCEMLFDPATKLPPMAVIYDADIEDAESTGATHLAWIMQGIARTKGKTLGYHEREVRIPIKIAKMIAFPDYGAYLADRERRLADGE